MTKKNNNNLFLLSVSGAQPIKKSDRIKRPIPKQKIQTKINTKAAIKEENNELEKKTKTQTSTEYKIEINKTNKMLKKGRVQINKKIDFHGHSLKSAKEIFDQTINDCFQSGFRCILFITGKGLTKGEESIRKQNKLYGGKIRKEFMFWAQEKKHSNKILNVQQASIKHGGDGAFFIYLRKKKD